MTELCAIQADYVNWRPVNGRKVLQLVFEVPLENTHDVLTRLGTPTPGESKWCAIALLNTKLGRDHQEPSLGSQPNGEREVSGSASTSLQTNEVSGSSKKWSEYARSQQCAILCKDQNYWRYIKAECEDDAIIWTKAQLDVHSRKELDEPKHHRHWDEFVALYNLHRERHK